MAMDYSILVFTLLFPLFWVGLLSLLKELSGWGVLAEKYAAPASVEQCSGTMFPMEHVSVKFVNYKGAITLGFFDEGLYLKPMVLFSLFHQPLLIPWGDLVLEEHAKAGVFRRGFVGIRVDVRAMNGAYFRFYNKSSLAIVAKLTPEG